jgi:flavin reductase (DIM6/NTAB) family NADH-FMN oxidoreductase RutF
MKGEFKSIDPADLTGNPFDLVGEKWMLISAGNKKAFNTMTASWGGMGVLWAKKVCFCVVRPGRHTYRFIESADLFTLSFFDESFRGALTFCGSHSGRDVDKVKETGLTPIFANGSVYFAEARLVFVCKKVYFQDIDPANFLDPSMDKAFYPNKDYHRMYVGEIKTCLVKER